MRRGVTYSLGTLQTFCMQHRGFTGDIEPEIVHKPKYRSVGTAPIERDQRLGEVVYHVKTMCNQLEAEDEHAEVMKKFVRQMGWFSGYVG